MLAYPQIECCIGITGEKSSGKGVIGSVLKARGFAERRYSEPIREVAKKRSLERGGDGSYDVAELQDIGDYLHLHEPRFLTTWVLDAAVNDGGRHVVIDGIRSPLEIEMLNKMLGQRFTHVGVTAPLLRRWEWCQRRGQEGDPKTFEGFLEMDERDRGLGQPWYGQQVDWCLGRIRDVDPSLIYHNVGTKEDLQAWVTGHVMSKVQSRQLAVPDNS